MECEQMPKINQEDSGKAKAASRKNRIIPKKLLAIHFDDLQGWLAAYRSHDAQLVGRSMISAFRGRYLLSQKEAAKRLGVATNTLSGWENGKSKIRWKSRNELVTAGWFKPQHFGLDAPASEFTGKEEDGE